MVEIVQIRTAYAAGLDAHFNLAGAERFRLGLFNAQVLGGVDDDAFHKRVSLNNRRQQWFSGKVRGEIIADQLAHRLARL